MELKPLYKVNLIEHEGQHRYTINDDPTFLPGVTGILNEINKPFLLQWAAKEAGIYIKNEFLKLHPKYRDRISWDIWVDRAKKEHKFIKEKAARIGTEAHKQFDDVINQKSYPSFNEPFIKSFDHWLCTNKVKIIARDTKVASLEYGYGGSLDVLLEEEGKLVVADFKTGKSLYESHSYQVSSYCQALQETYDLDYLPGGYVIRFQKYKPQYEIRKIRDINDSFKAFKAALDLYKAQQLIHFSERKTVKEKKVKKIKEKAHDTTQAES